MTPDQAAALEALATRVEGLVGASREVDGDVAELLDLAPKEMRRFGRTCFWDERSGHIAGQHWGAPAFTSDPAAPLREIERRFPGTAFSVGWCERETHAWALDDGKDGLDVLTSAQQDSVTGAMARALTALLLRLTARSAADGR